jgi:hypothetical protein
MPSQESHWYVPSSHTTKNLHDPLPLPNLANKRRYPIQTKYSGLNSRQVTPGEHLSKSQPIDVERLEKIAKYGYSSGFEKMSVPDPVVKYKGDGNRLSPHTSIAVKSGTRTSSNQSASRYAYPNQLQCAYPTPAPTAITRPTIHLITSPQTSQWQQNTPTTGAEALDFISQHSGPRNPHLANAISAEASWRMLGRNEKAGYLKRVMLGEDEGKDNGRGENEGTTTRVAVRIRNGAGAGSRSRRG